MTDYNVLTLAYIGDAVYEVYIREFLIKKGLMKVNKLQIEAINYVSANAQRKLLEKLLNENVFTEEETSVIYRARNHKGTRHPKNTDIITYKYATAFEAVIGYLYLKKDLKRLKEIINYIEKE